MESADAGRVPRKTRAAVRWRSFVIRGGGDVFYPEVRRECELNRLCRECEIRNCSSPRRVWV